MSIWQFQDHWTSPNGVRVSSDGPRVSSPAIWGPLGPMSLKARPEIGRFKCPQYYRCGSVHHSVSIVNCIWYDHIAGMNWEARKSSLWRFYCKLRMIESIAGKHWAVRNAHYSVSIVNCIWNEHIAGMIWALRNCFLWRLCLNYTWYEKIAGKNWAAQN